ncbi:MAG: DegV family protein [Atopobiaceae bacterium]|nr:DegV family protein [Atopobiaceae bacterium]
MADYALSCCSTADLTLDHFNRRDIRWVPFHYELDGVQHLDDLYQTMDAQTFYDAMAAGADTKTSQINVQEFKDHFEKILAEGKNILHVTLSSGISGVIQSAEIAASEVMKEHPGALIYVVDSLAASSGYGLLMDKLADLRDAGMPLEELNSWALANRLHVHHWFYSTDLTFFIKGGRVSKVSGFFGTALKICPLLNVDRFGRLIPREKIRTKKRAAKAALAKMVEHADTGTDYAGKVYISQSACRADAEELAAMIESTFPKLNGSVQIYDIGTTIGSHTGPGTIALFFWGDKRVD